MAGAVGRWVALPASTQMDPRSMGLSADAELFLVRSWLYAGEHSTDGAIPPSALPLLCMKLSTPADAVLDELRAAGLVVAGKKAHQGQDVIDGYLDINPTATQVKKRSDHARKAAMTRWAKEKRPSDESESQGRGDAESDTSNASGSASGIDGQSDEHAMGNAPYLTTPDKPDAFARQTSDSDSALAEAESEDDVGSRGTSSEMPDEIRAIRQTLPGARVPA